MISVKFSKSDIAGLVVLDIVVEVLMVELLVVGLLVVELLVVELLVLFLVVDADVVLVEEDVMVLLSFSASIASKKGMLEVLKCSTSSLNHLGLINNVATSSLNFFKVSSMCSKSVMILSSIGPGVVVVPLLVVVELAFS